MDFDSPLAWPDLVGNGNCCIPGREVGMDETIAVRHFCQADCCGRPFAVVCRQSPHDVPLPMAVACPRCGRWAVVMVPTGAVRETEGSYVLPLEPQVAALTV
jgi:hypothetical protein